MLLRLPCLLHCCCCPATDCAAHPAAASVHLPPALPLIPLHRGLAGPDTSSSDDEENSDEEAGSGSGSEEEDEEEGGSEEDEDADEDEKVFRQRRPVLPRRGAAEEEEPLNEEDLEEWGVGALAANPEEPVRRGCAAGLWGGWAGAACVAGVVGAFDAAAAAAAAVVVDAQQQRHAREMAAHPTRPTLTLPAPTVLPTADPAAAGRHAAPGGCGPGLGPRAGRGHPGCAALVCAERRRHPARGGLPLGCACVPSLPRMCCACSLRQPAALPSCVPAGALQ